MCATASASKAVSSSAPIACLARRKASRGFPIILRASSSVSPSARASDSSWEVMILREYFTTGADVAFLQKCAGMPYPIRSCCEARHAQQFSNSNRNCDIVAYATINRPKSQNASPLLESKLLFYSPIHWQRTQRAEHFVRCSLVICAKLPCEIDACRGEPVAGRPSSPAALYRFLPF